MWSKKKGRSSEMYEKGRWRGCEPAGVIHLDRVTAWPQAHWGGQRQHRDTGEAVGTLSLFVTLAWPSIHENTPLPTLCLPPFSFSKLSSTLALVFFPFPTWLPPPARLSFLLWPPSLGLLVLSLSFFSYSPSWLHTSDPLNNFTHSIFTVCLLTMISQSLFALLSTVGSGFPISISTSLLFSAPFLSPCRITLDIYSTAISLWGDENRFSLQQLLLSD